jgi:predicted dinucleotide-binding enzyme
VAGDDADARGVAVELLRELGWRDIIEFEHLEAARGLEMWMPLWLRLMQKLGRPAFNLRIVR